MKRQDQVQGVPTETRDRHKTTTGQICFGGMTRERASGLAGVHWQQWTWNRWFAAAFNERRAIATLFDANTSMPNSAALVRQRVQR